MNRPPSFAHRALWRPNQLDILEKLDAGFDNCGRGFGYTQAFHKKDIEPVPHRVACEYVASRIGRFIGLPIPPYAITKFDPEGACVFSSLDFNFERQKLPPVDAELAVKNLPLLCAGVLMLDIFVGNEDRHDKNVVVDRVAKPSRLQVYDFDQSLVQGAWLSGEDRLQALKKDLGVTGKPPIRGNRHIFLRFVESEKHLKHWIGLIESIPEFFLRDTCDYAHQEIGLEKNLSAALFGFLYERQDLLRGLVINTVMSLTGFI